MTRAMWTCALSLAALQAVVAFFGLGDAGNVWIAAGFAVVIGLWMWTTVEPREPKAEPTDNPASEALQHWQTKAERLLEWSDGTQSDWDRHIRPWLADIVHRVARTSAHGVARREIEIVGTDLWRWVDPATTTWAPTSGAAPGREILTEILSRIERVA